MKKFTRKQAEEILSNKGKFWCNCHDLHVINNEAIKNKDNDLYHATMNLNGYILGY